MTEVENSFLEISILDGDAENDKNPLCKNQKNSYKCSYCNASFRSKFLFTDHTRKCDRDDTPYQCLVCQATFPSEDDFVNHSSITHKEEKPFQCCVCKKKYILFASLQHHILFHSKKSARSRKVAVGPGFSLRELPCQGAKKGKYEEEEDREPEN